MGITYNFIKMQRRREEERLNLARKFAEKLNIDEVAEISGLSKEQILNPQPK